MFEHTKIDEATKKFMKTAALSIIDYVLEVGLDQALANINPSEKELVAFPNVANALKERCGK